MAELHQNSLLHHLRHLVGSVPQAALTDSQLLERFVDQRDETAVEVLIRRHGPLVFGVCRRVLHNVHAAEDAFQATFLILARKAPSLVRRERLGSWLYKIAYRLALRARANEMRRQQCEARAVQSHPGLVSHATTHCDLVVALEEELQRLPARHRTPLVLCYFEGKTNQEAAQTLGCPPGSISARLAQARERLRECLARRGFVAPATGVASLLSTAAAEAVVPLPLLSNTVQAVLWFASQRAVGASAVSLEAVALARGAVRTMLLHKLQIAAAVVLAATMLGTGATMLLRGATAPTQTTQEQPLEVRPNRAEIADERLPDGAVARMGSRRLRHADAVSFAAYLPDGKALVTAGRDKQVRLWELGTGKEIHRFTWDEVAPGNKLEPAEAAAQRRDRQFWDDTARSCQAALSADGKLVAASRGGEVCLWETATGKKLRQLDTGQKRLLQLAFAADGKSLLTLGLGQATAVWEVATGTCLRRNAGKPVPQYLSALAQLETQNAVVSPGLKYLASGGRDNNGIVWIEIRDLTTDRQMPRIQAAPGVMTMAFSADDKTLFWELREDSIIASDVASGRELRRLKVIGRNGSPTAGDSILAFAVSVDGRRLAVSWMSNTIELWDLKSGKQLLPLGKTSNAQYEQRSTNWLSFLVRPALAFSADGNKLVSSLGGATIRQFDTETGVEIPAPGIGHRGPVSTLALSGDGKTLCTYSPGDPARCWSWSTGREIGQRDVPANASHAAFATNGQYSYVAGGECTLSSEDGKKVRRFGVGNSMLDAFALSPDGAFVATRKFMSAEVHLWDTATLKEVHVLGRAGDRPPGSGAVTETTGVLPPDLVFSPDGRWLAADGPSRQLCLWNVAKGTLLWGLPLRAGEAIERFAFSANGRVLATIQADHTVALYEVISGTKRARLGEPDPKRRRAYLTDGSRSPADSTQMRTDAPVCLAFSPDGRYLALAQETPEIHLWDIRAGREIGQLVGHQGGVVSLLFTRDGKQLFSGSTETTVLTWDLTRFLKGESAPVADLPKGTLETLWTDLAGNDGPRAFEAIRKLSAAPSQAVTFLNDRVRPATPPDPDRLARLLADLDSDRFAVRRQAQSELEGLGELAEPAMRKALAGDCSLELRQRLEQLLNHSARQVPMAGKLRDQRAVELLELIGNAEARRLLQVLAEGAPQARLTQEARSALRRLTRPATTP